MRLRSEVSAGPLWTALRSHWLSIHMAMLRARRWFANHFSRVPPPVAFLLLLQAGDVEINTGPICNACGQNFSQHDRPIVCHTTDCGIITHKLTRCSDIAQQLKPLTSATAVTTRSGQAQVDHLTFIGGNLNDYEIRRPLTHPSTSTSRKTPHCL